MKRLIVAALVCLCAAVAHAGVVWDYAPVNGDAVCCWQNQTAQQNFADNVMFGTNTTITGFNLFTGNFPPSGTYNVHLYADSGGVPGALISSQDVTASNFLFYGSFNGVDVYEVVLNLTPLNLASGVQYWIGASGNGFEAGQLSLKGPGDPGDGQMAQFAGPNYIFMTQVGDQSFQLVSGVGGVPEPSSLLLLGTGVVGLFGTLRRKLF